MKDQICFIYLRALLRLRLTEGMKDIGGIFFSFMNVNLPWVGPLFGSYFFIKWGDSMHWVSGVMMKTAECVDETWIQLLHLCTCVCVCLCEILIDRCRAKMEDWMKNREREKEERVRGAKILIRFSRGEGVGRRAGITSILSQLPYLCVLYPSDHRIQLSAGMLLRIHCRYAH